MFEKYKVFVRGSTETKEVLGEIARKRGIIINRYQFSDNSDCQFGKCPTPDSNLAIWYTDSRAPMFFIDYGYKEVTPQEFREIWLEEESPKKEKKSKEFCCEGCEKLREVCQRLAKEGFVNPSLSDFEKAKDDYYHFVCDKTVVYRVNGAPNGEIVSPEEFYERISGKPWKEKKKYLGFIGDSDVKISLLPKEIKNPRGLKGTARGCIFYIENNELTYCPIGKEPKDISFEVTSYDVFLLTLACSTYTVPKQCEEFKVKRLLISEDCFESKQKTKETNFIQAIVKNPSENFLHLSEEKPLKIIL